MLKWIKYAAGFIVLVVLDQLTKVWAVKTLADGTVIPVIKNVIEFLYVENRGAAFGMLKGGLVIFVIIALAALIGIGVLLHRIPETKRYLPLRISLVAIAAGAVGNLIDRCTHVYVVDFIYFKPIDFPVFNFADICVTCGAILMAILILFVYKEAELNRILRKKEEE